jgi:hypothetical protein
MSDDTKETVQPARSAQPYAQSGLASQAHGVPCCPQFAPNDICDVLDFHYRLTYPTVVEAEGINRQKVPVEVKLHFRLTRCRGPLAIGDLLYTTTLLPGEKVRLFTSDRRSKFTFDTATKFGYRNSQSSEESFFMQQMSDSLFDVSSRDSATSSNQSHAHVDGHGDAGIDIFGLGGSANMSGNFDSNSLSTFLGEHSQHAESSFHAAEMGTRKAASTSIGESQSRTHTESESQDHYESASREFENKNQCQAVTFLFYQINKTQTVKYTLEAVELRVMMDTDPRRDFTRVDANPVGLSTGVGITSTTVLATEQGRRVKGEDPALGTPDLPFDVAPKLSAALREAAIKQAQKELADAGLLEAGGKVSAAAKASYSFEKQSALPTPGVLVKASLDDCTACEPARRKQIELDLEHQRLQNELLKKQIDLLDKSQEYRCCPQGGTTDGSDQ